MKLTNLRIIDKFNRSAGEWYAVGNPQKVQDQINRAKSLLSDLRKNYPNDGYVLQTRGDIGVWHTWED